MGCQKKGVSQKLSWVRSDSFSSQGIRRRPLEGESPFPNEAQQNQTKSSSSQIESRRNRPIQEARCELVHAESLSSPLDSSDYKLRLFTHRTHLSFFFDSIEFDVI